MRATLLILLISYLFFQIPEKKKIDLKKESKCFHFKLDTLRIKQFLNEPIDYHKLDNSRIKVIRADSISELIAGSYIKYSYFSENNKVAEMKGFQHKIDSIWPFGHNGWFMNSFICESNKLPLKFNLYIDSDIKEFIKFFGKPTTQNSSLIFYDFSTWKTMKEMKVYIENKKVKKLEIITTNEI